MTIDIAFERHAGAQAADASLRRLEKTLIDSDLPSPTVALECGPRTSLAVRVSLSSNDGSYRLNAVYVPADSKKPDHIAVTARLADGVHTRVSEVFDLALQDAFNYSRKW